MSLNNQGHTVVIEGVGESIDAVLDPVLSRAVFKKGRSLFIRMGGEDVEYDQNFKLYLQVRLRSFQDACVIALPIWCGIVDPRVL
jgi:hypothetical protein